MAPKSEKKIGLIGIIRLGGPSTVCIVARAFQIREDLLAKGFLDIIFEPLDRGGMSRRVLFDLSFLRQNTDTYTGYSAKLDVDVDDAAQIKDAICTSEGLMANIYHSAHLGDRAESTFSLVSIGDWADSLKSLKPNEERTVKAAPVLAVYSALGFQKKFISELLRLATQSI